MARRECDKRATEKYQSTHITQFLVKVNKATMPEVISRLEEVESKQGYIVALIRADLAKRGNGVLTLGNLSIKSCDVSKYAEAISVYYEAIRANCKRSELASVDALFLPDTAPYIIVGEYLRNYGDITVKIVNC